MITLLTGVPGAGKTLSAVAMALDALKQGRAVYTDIAGFNAPGALPAPLDWRDTPEGSLVIYDEAQKTYPSTGKPGVSEDERIRALETHRHTGHDLVFITQSPALVHHHIRKLVGRHIHVHRAAGLKRATRYTWDFAVADPNDRREQERGDTENWFYPKDLFRYYKSATVHTHKFQIPKKIAIALVAIVIVVGLASWRLVSHGGLATMNLSEEPTGEQAAAEGLGPAPPPASLSADGVLWNRPVLPSVAGCAVLTNSCRCWSGEGAQLDLDRGQCLTLAHSPLPINFSGFQGNGNSTGKRKAGRTVTGPGAEVMAGAAESADTVPGV